MPPPPAAAPSPSPSPPPPPPPLQAVFTATPTSGIIPPDGEQTVSFHYKPKVAGTFTQEHYDILTPGGNSVVIEAVQRPPPRGTSTTAAASSTTPHLTPSPRPQVAEAIGPELELSRDHINFGDVPIVLPRKHVTRVLEILNHSDAPVPYARANLRNSAQFAAHFDATRRAIL